MPNDVWNDELLGVAEAASLLHLSKPALADRRVQSDFPKPVAVLACGPIWSRESLEAYARMRNATYVERIAVVQLAEDSELPEELGLADLERVLGRDREWIFARTHVLPCRMTFTGSPRVRREDLRAWLQAARKPEQTRETLGEERFEDGAWPPRDLRMPVPAVPQVSA